MIEMRQLVITPLLGIVAGRGLPGALARDTGTPSPDMSAVHPFPTSVAARATGGTRTAMPRTTLMAAETNLNFISFPFDRTGSGEHNRHRERMHGSGRSG